MQFCASFRLLVQQPKRLIVMELFVENQELEKNTSETKSDENIREDNIERTAISELKWEEIAQLQSSRIKQILRKAGVSCANIEDKKDLQKLLSERWCIEKGVMTPQSNPKQQLYEEVRRAPKDIDDPSSSGAKGGDKASNKIPKATKAPLSLAEIIDAESIHDLTVRQIKEILKRHVVDFSTLTEKKELECCLTTLWEDYKKGTTIPPLRKRCVICQKEQSNCIFLNCGHLVTCKQCGFPLNECPICRQYVVRAVQVFSA